MQAARLHLPGSEIYGGLGSTWDYGPLGVELKSNVKERLVAERGLRARRHGGPRRGHPDEPPVWKASGHEETFTDPLVDCRTCKRRFRADHLKGDGCPECGGELTEPRTFK